MAFRENLAAFQVERELSSDFIRWGPEEADRASEKNSANLDDHKHDFPTGKRLSVYLAGTVEMGKAPDWQKAVAKQLQDYPIAVLSPRREHFENWADQSKNNAALMRQIEWEWNCLKSCDLIIMYLHAGTVSPISLLELGHFSRGSDQGRIMVCCPPGFNRQANVQYVCKAEGVTLCEDIEEFINEIRAKVEKLLG